MTDRFPDPPRRPRLPALLAPFALLALSVPAACTSIDRIAATPVMASAETDAMTGTGDKADDPAIWVHPTDPAQSRILGTNKDDGLHVYDLSGRELQTLPIGQLNNVDLVDGLAAASNDEIGAISWFAIDPVSGAVSHVIDTPVERVEPYGFCLGRAGGALTAAVTYKDGTVELWAPVLNEGRVTGARLTRTVTLADQLEGCVFDPGQDRLFIGEEAFGIWSLDLSDPTSAPVLVDSIAAGNGLVEDTEGLTIWAGAGGTGYLVASAQAADRYVVYDRAPPHAVRGVFSIAGNAAAGIDAVTHTDGIAVTAAPLPGYPRGLFVAQDDGNPASGVDQNFKLVDWQAVETALDLDPIAPAGGN